MTFNPDAIVVGTILEYDNKFLLLCRHPDKREGHKWGLPAGKVEKGESLEDAAMREIKEETGNEIILSKENYVVEFPENFPDKKVLFHCFKVKLDKPIKVKIEPSEHIEHKWVSLQEALQMNDLVKGLDQLLKKVYGIN